MNFESTQPTSADTSASMQFLKGGDGSLVHWTSSISNDICRIKVFSLSGHVYSECEIGSYFSSIIDVTFWCERSIGLVIGQLASSDTDSIELGALFIAGNTIRHASWQTTPVIQLPIEGHMDISQIQSILCLMKISPCGSNELRMLSNKNEYDKAVVGVVGFRGYNTPLCIVADPFVGFCQIFNVSLTSGLVGLEQSVWSPFSFLLLENDGRLNYFEIEAGLDFDFTLENMIHAEYQSQNFESGELDSILEKEQRSENAEMVIAVNLKYSTQLKSSCFKNQIQKMILTSITGIFPQISPSLHSYSSEMDFSNSSDESYDLDSFLSSANQSDTSLSTAILIWVLARNTVVVYRLVLQPKKPSKDFDDEHIDFLKLGKFDGDSANNSVEYIVDLEGSSVLKIDGKSYPIAYDIVTVGLGSVELPISPTLSSHVMLSSSPIFESEIQYAAVINMSSCQNSMPEVTGKGNSTKFICGTVSCSRKVVPFPQLDHSSQKNTGESRLLNASEDIQLPSNISVTLELEGSYEVSGLTKLPNPWLFCKSALFNEFVHILPTLPLIDGCKLENCSINLAHSVFFLLLKSKEYLEPGGHSFLQPIFLSSSQLPSVSDFTDEICSLAMEGEESALSSIQRLCDAIIHASSNVLGYYRDICERYVSIFEKTILPKKLEVTEFWVQTIWAIQRSLLSLYNQEIIAIKSINLDVGGCISLGLLNRLSKILFQVAVTRFFLSLPNISDSENDCFLDQSLNNIIHLPECRQSISSALYYYRECLIKELLISKEKYEAEETELDFLQRWGSSNHVMLALDVLCNLCHIYSEFGTARDNETTCKVLSHDVKVADLVSVILLDNLIGSDGKLTFPYLCLLSYISITVESHLVNESSMTFGDIQHKMEGCWKSLWALLNVSYDYLTITQWGRLLFLSDHPHGSFSGSEVYLSAIEKDSFARLFIKNSLFIDMNFPIPTVVPVLFDGLFASGKLELAFQMFTFFLSFYQVGKIPERIGIRLTFLALKRKSRDHLLTLFSHSINTSWNQIVLRALVALAVKDSSANILQSVVVDKKKNIFIKEMIVDISISHSSEAIRRSAECVIVGFLVLRRQMQEALEYCRKITLKRPQDSDHLQKLTLLLETLCPNIPVSFKNTEAHLVTLSKFSNSNGSQVLNPLISSAATPFQSFSKNSLLNGKYSCNEKRHASCSLNKGIVSKADILNRNSVLNTTCSKIWDRTQSVCGQSRPCVYHDFTEY